MTPCRRRHVVEMAPPADCRRHTRCQIAPGKTPIGVMQNADRPVQIPSQANGKEETDQGHRCGLHTGGFGIVVDMQLWRRCRQKLQRDEQQVSRAIRQYHLPDGQIFDLVGQQPPCLIACRRGTARPRMSRPASSQPPFLEDIRFPLVSDRRHIALCRLGRQSVVSGRIAPISRFVDRLSGRTGDQSGGQQPAPWGHRGGAATVRRLGGAPGASGDLPKAAATATKTT